VEHRTDRDATIEQLFARGFDVGDDEVQALGGAGCRRGDVRAEDEGLLMKPVATDSRPSG
jgi:hypothetical protein